MTDDKRQIPNPQTLVEMSAIVLTGYDDPVLRKETSGVGVEFLMKPVRAVQLLDAINQPV